MAQRRFISVQILARELGLPATWLRSEEEADRLPVLKGGTKLLFDREAVEQALSQRAGNIPKQGEGTDE